METVAKMGEVDEIHCKEDKIEAAAGVKMNGDISKESDEGSNSVPYNSTGKPDVEESSETTTPTTTAAAETTEDDDDEDDDEPEPKEVNKKSSVATAAIRRDADENSIISSTSCNKEEASSSANNATTTEDEEDDEDVVEVSEKAAENGAQPSVNGSTSDADSPSPKRKSEDLSVKKKDAATVGGSAAKKEVQKLSNGNDSSSDIIVSGAAAANTTSKDSAKSEQSAKQQLNSSGGDDVVVVLDDHKENGNGCEDDDDDDDEDDDGDGEKTDDEGDDDDAAASDKKRKAPSECSVDDGDGDGDTEVINLDTPIKKKKRPSESLTPPRRSSRNLNKQRSYIEKEDEPDEISSEDPDVEEVLPEDPLAVGDVLPPPAHSTPQPPLAHHHQLLLQHHQNHRKNRPTIHPVSANSSTIVVSDTKRLVEIAACSKPTSSGKKEPTLVIIDTNSILSGHGPIPIAQKMQQHHHQQQQQQQQQLQQSPQPPMAHQHQHHSSSSSSHSHQHHASPYAMGLPMALPAQGVYPPNMRATITPIPMVHHPPPQPQAPPPPPPKPQPPPVPVLPTLTDDMYVVEAPSFIVPYVYEKPPIKEFKKFVEDVGKQLAEERKARDKELEAEEKEKEKEKEKEEKEPKTCSTEDAAEGEAKTTDKEPAATAASPSASAAAATEATPATGGGSTVAAAAAEEIVDLEKKIDEAAAQNELIKEKKLQQEKDKPVTIDVDDLPETPDKPKATAMGAPPTAAAGGTPATPTTPASATTTPTSAAAAKHSYFDNALGKFFIDIGFNLVQEFVQTDLLKQQKRKRDREMSNNSKTNYAIQALLKNLEYTKENNEPFKMTQKKCEFCSFKTESELVLAHHLETPHMKNYVYRCNFCPLEVRNPHDILFHMEAEHNVKAHLERAPQFHQCPNCSFEDNQKGKLSRHAVACARKFKPERNLEAPADWEPPAKIPRVPRMKQHGLGATAAAYQAMAKSSNFQFLPKMHPNPAAQVIHRGRGRPSLMGKMPTTAQSLAMRNNAAMASMYAAATKGVVPNPVLVPTTYQLGGNQVYQVVGGQDRLSHNPLAYVPSSSTVTIQTSTKSASQLRNFSAQNSSRLSNSGSASGKSGKPVHQPSISITPLPRGGGGGGGGSSASSPSTGTAALTIEKAKAGDTNSKSSFVICEICDGYIKDLEQLRNHMQWIHKVKIHPKMIYNRPPLNCQKCQFRFFTDQGLERHLLGSHGLVTSSMQEAANKSKDSGRCPVCGRVYQWKLLNHVARDHNMTLKPAHLSYKCTVCTATFGMYKQFETHVYSAHSVVAKRAMDKKSGGGGGSSNKAADQGGALMKPLKINDEITIIPQPAKTKDHQGKSKSKWC